MPLVMFNIADVMKNFASHPTNVKELVCLSLMAAINWLREVLNAFATENGSEDVPVKVVQRAKSLRELEHHLLVALPEHPTFSLLRSAPPVVFDKVSPRAHKAPSSAPGRPAAKETKEDSNKLRRSMATHFSIVQCSALLGWTRCLELDAFAIFHQRDKQFQLKQLDAESETEDQIAVGLASEKELVHFLLLQLHFRVKQLLRPPTKFPTAVGDGEGISVDKALTHAQVLAKLTPLLASARIVVQQSCQDDNTNEAASKVVRCRIMEEWLGVVSRTLQCARLKGDEAGKSAMAVLSVLGDETGVVVGSQSSITTVAEAAVNYFTDLAEDIQSCAAACELLSVFEQIFALVPPSDDHKKLISDASFKFLFERWSVAPKGTHIAQLIRCAVRFSTQPLVRMHEVYQETLQKAFKEGKESEGESSDNDKSESALPSRCMLPVYKALVEEAAEQFSTLELSDKDDDLLREGCEQIRLRLSVWGKLIAYACEVQTQTVVSVLLKNTSGVVSCLSTRCLPFLNAHFNNEVVFQSSKAVIKSCSRFSRKLKWLCDFGKKCADAQVLKSVPMLKRALERLIFSVKELLGAHDCLSADLFQIRTINHRLYEVEEDGHVCSQLVPVDEQARFRKKWVGSSGHGAAHSDDEDGEQAAVTKRGTTEREGDEEDVQADMEVEDKDDDKEEVPAKKANKSKSKSKSGDSKPATTDEPPGGKKRAPRALKGAASKKRECSLDTRFGGDSHTRFLVGTSGKVTADKSSSPS
eukprot:c18843_g1_i3.p1 GENE.c18843_g1_i3~~c18843_g1_i3.p1  ORF type:complete len:755 (-),score=152.76 c18843_g1_i3:906-3170(-)